MNTKKNGIYVALICFAIIPAYAQNTASPDRHPAAGETSTALVQGYADDVNGLLRDVHATLQEISGRMEAGELTPEQGQKLKLAATRSMIARLETISAVYDAKVGSKHDGEHYAVVSPAAAAAKNEPAHSVFTAKSTISVDELKRGGK